MSDVTMRQALIFLNTLISAAALGTISCGSDDSGKTPVIEDAEECTPVGVKCPTSNNFDEALCKNKDETQYWYRICADAACTTGTDILCNGDDCSDAAKPAADACLVRLPG